MEIEEPKDESDFTLKNIVRQDLYSLSIGDLEERVASLKAEIVRCEKALSDRGSTRVAAEKLFKF